jgi:hypothetical protein
MAVAGVPTEESLPEEEREGLGKGSVGNGCGRVPTGGYPSPAKGWAKA